MAFGVNSEFAFVSELFCGPNGPHVSLWQLRLQNLEISKMKIRQTLVSLCFLFNGAAIAGAFAAETDQRQQKQEATKVISALIDLTDSPRISSMRLKALPGLGLMDDKRQDAENSLKFSSSSRLISEVTFSEGPSENGKTPTQLLTVEFSIKPDGNRGPFLLNCFSSQDMKRLLSSDWVEGSILIPGRVEFSKPSGNQVYVLRSAPDYEADRNSCLTSISIFLLNND